LSIEAFLEDYGEKEQCERALEALCWPQGDRCPKCQGSYCSFGPYQNRHLGHLPAFNFAKYANRYLVEAQYRFNWCFNLPILFRRLLRACATTRPYPILVLRMAEVR
jgi:hypothetical protein